MGKGRVLQAHGAGRYTIEIVEDRARAESARALAASRIAGLDQRLVELEDGIANAQLAVDAAAAAQDAAIEQYQGEMATEGESEVDLATAARTVIEAAAARDTLRTTAGQLNAQRLALQSRIELIDALPPLRQVEAWCADYTETLAGDVATAEVPGEIGQALIKPAYDGAESTSWPAALQNGAVWSPSVDGAIQPALSGTPAGVFYNLAMLPGWQRWRPTFRIATINALSGDLCDITLDPATSSQQSLAVNSQSEYSGVPIYYMQCNGAIFDVGDRVLVAFSGNTQAPMVVGFESSPRLCKQSGFLDVLEFLEKLYGPDAMEGIFYDQQVHESNLVTSEGGAYTCGGVTYTEILYEVQDSVEPQTRNHLTGSPLLVWKPGNLVDVVGKSSPPFMIDDNVQQAALSVSPEYIINQEAGISVTGSGGKTSSGFWDSGCKPGYTITRKNQLGTNYTITTQGQVDILGETINWQRQGNITYSEDILTTRETSFIEDETWPRYGIYSEDGGDDAVSVGDVVANVHQIREYFTGIKGVAAPLGLVLFMPEVYSAAEGRKRTCVITVAFFSTFGGADYIDHYLVAFQANGGAWSRADVPSDARSAIISGSTRRAALQQITGQSYLQNYYSVPKEVG